MSELEIMGSGAERSVSFIVAVRDEPRELLDATIEGLLRTSTAYSCEIVLVDDGSLIPLDLERPEVTVIRNSEPIGSARSRRTGASFANGEVLVFLDPHMSFADDWLERMLTHVGTGSLLCAAWWDYELARPVCWGADFMWSGERDYAAGRCPGFAFRHRTTFPGEGAVEVPMLIGACYMMLRTSYERLGGFSPFFRTWGRLEQDLCTRAWIVGLGVKCVTGSKVGHYSRSKFPYPVRWEDIEFNQVATLRTAFDEGTARTLEALMQPLPALARAWLQASDFDEWRGWVQSRREMSDREFFSRFVANAPQLPAAIGI